MLLYLLTALLTPFPVIVFINEEATGCINEDAIDAINEADIGDMIGPRNPSFCFLFHAILFSSNISSIYKDFIYIFIQN